jgi:signal peptidase I
VSEKSWSREWLEAILIAVVFALFVRTFVAQAFKIPSGSMEDSLLVGDHLFVNKFIYAPHWKTPLHALMPYRDVRRSDVVVFKYPQDPERDFIKRAVAVGGDLVEVRAKGVTVNGRPEDQRCQDPRSSRTAAPPGRSGRATIRPYRPRQARLLHGRPRLLDDSRFWAVPRGY